MNNTAIKPRKAFTTVKLMDGRTATILEVNGYDIFNASTIAGGNVAAMPYYLLIEATLIDGKKMESMAELENLSGCDTMAIMDVIALQITKTPQL